MRRQKFFKFTNVLICTWFEPAQDLAPLGATPTVAGEEGKGHNATLARINTATSDWPLWLFPTLVRGAKPEAATHPIEQMQRTAHDKITKMSNYVPLLTMDNH